MKYDWMRMLGLAFCLVLPASTAYAGKGNAKGNHGKKAERSDVRKYKGPDSHINIGVFIEQERGLIRNHFVGAGGSLPPGLAKRGGDLPPGLAKQLRRNGHLPPGLEKKLYPFPVELERRLPPLGEGLMRGFIGGHAVVMNKRTSVILDIFSVF